MASGTIASRQFKNVKIYWCDLNVLNKFGKYSLTIQGLSDEDKDFVKQSSKKITKDLKTNEDQIRFAIAPEKIDNLVLVDSRNHKWSRSQSIPNGSTVNVAVSLFQNAMGTYLLLKGIQIVSLAPSKGSSAAVFDDLGEDEGTSPYNEEFQGDVDG